MNCRISIYVKFRWIDNINVIYIFIYYIPYHIIIILYYAKRYTELGPSEKHWFYRLRNCYRPHTFVAAHPPSTMVIPFLRRCVVPPPPPLPSDEYAPFWVISYWYFATFPVVVVVDDAACTAATVATATATAAAIATATGAVDCGHVRRIARPRLPLPPPPVSLINIKPRHWRPVNLDGMDVRGWGESGLITAPVFLSLSYYLVCVCFPFFPPSLNESIRARTLIIGILVYGIRLLYPLDTIRTRFFSPFFPLHLSPKSL